MPKKKIEEERYGKVTGAKAVAAKRKAAATRRSRAAARTPNPMSADVEVSEADVEIEIPRSILLELPEDELAALQTMADAHMRTPEAQMRWVLKRVIEAKPEWASVEGQRPRW